MSESLTFGGANLRISVRMSIVAEIIMTTSLTLHNAEKGTHSCSLTLFNCRRALLTIMGYTSGRQRDADTLADPYDSIVSLKDVITT